jgi:hypothetical protein
LLRFVKPLRASLSILRRVGCHKSLGNEFALAPVDVGRHPSSRSACLGFIARMQDNFYELMERRKKQQVEKDRLNEKVDESTAPIRAAGGANGNVPIGQQRKSLSYEFHSRLSFGGVAPVSALVAARYAAMCASPPGSVRYAPQPRQCAAHTSIKSGT